MFINFYYYIYSFILRLRLLEDNFKEINENVGILFVRLLLVLLGYLGIFYR